MCEYASRNRFIRLGDVSGCIFFMGRLKEGFFSSAKPCTVANNSPNPVFSLLLYSNIHNLEEMQILLDRLTGVKPACISTLSAYVVVAGTHTLAGGRELTLLCVLPTGSIFPEDTVGVMPLCFILLNSHCFSAFSHCWFLNNSKAFGLYYCRFVH